jgi:ribosomal protein S18 acetylase RimI-like enzyme
VSLALSLARIQTAARRDGVVPVALRVVRRATRPLIQREQHVWYALHLDAHRRSRRMPDGCELLRGGLEDLERLAELPTQPLIDDALARLAEGAELHVVRRGEDLVFAAWVFHRRTPAAAASDGWIDLPPDTVSIEDAATKGAERGRGIAPAAYDLIATRLAARGYRTLLMKVEVANRASRRAASKAGFRAGALVKLRRLGMRRRVAVTPLAEPRAGFLSAQLQR